MSEEFGERTEKKDESKKENFERFLLHFSLGHPYG